MSRIDFAIYAVHSAFWGSFGLTRLVLRALDRRDGPASETTPVSPQESTAPYSRTVLAFHMVAFFVMYLGLGGSVNIGRVPFWFAGQRVAGAIVIALGAALMCWALVYFRSWRFRAKVDEHHQLATGGPFRILRHPIYMGLNLLALGTAVWVPTAIVWAGFVLMVIGSDLRARAEERLLEHVFGAAYREYRAGTARFVPGIY